MQTLLTLGVLAIVSAVVSVGAVPLWSGDLHFGADAMMQLMGAGGGGGGDSEETAIHRREAERRRHLRTSITDVLAVHEQTLGIVRLGGALVLWTMAYLLWRNARYGGSTTSKASKTERRATMKRTAMLRTRR